MDVITTTDAIRALLTGDATFAADIATAIGQPVARVLRSNTPWEQISANVLPCFVMEQGDGETSQYALETSLDVEFEVELVHGAAIAMPRVESAQQLLVLGQAGSLDDALRSATAGLIQWLQQDYGLSLPECAQVLGSSVRYEVVTLAGRNAGLAAKLDKAVLATLGPKRP